MDDYGRKLYSAVVAMQCLIVATLKQLGDLNVAAGKHKEALTWCRGRASGAEASDDA